MGASSSKAGAGSIDTFDPSLKNTTKAAAALVKKSDSDDGDDMSDRPVKSVSESCADRNRLANWTLTGRW